MIETYNPFLQIIKSFEGFVRSEVYYKLRKQTTGSKILCALIVTVLLNLITFGISAAKLCTDKSLYDFIDSIPEFSYEKGSFQAEKKYETTSSGTYVLIDTSVPAYYSIKDDTGFIDAVNIDSLVKKAGENNSIREAMFFSETNAIQVNFITGQIQKIKYSEVASLLHITSFSKTAILSGYKGFIVKCAVILGLIWLPVQFVLIFLIAFIYCLLAQIGKAITKSEDDFNTIYWIAFYIIMAILLIKTILKNTIPFAGGMLNMLAFALTIFIILKTLKDGDPNSDTSYGSYPDTNVYTGAGGKVYTGTGGEVYTGAGSAFRTYEDTTFPQNDSYAGEDLSTINDTTDNDNSLSESSSSTGLSLKK